MTSQNIVLSSWDTLYLPYSRPWQWQNNFINICTLQWAEYIMNFPIILLARSKMIGGRAAVSANKVCDFANFCLVLLLTCHHNPKQNFSYLKDLSQPALSFLIYFQYYVFHFYHLKKYPAVYQYLISKSNILLHTLPRVLSMFIDFYFYLLVMFDSLIQENCTICVICVCNTFYNIRY
jgi:hypothetical protein